MLDSSEQQAPGWRSSCLRRHQSTLRPLRSLRADVTIRARAAPALRPIRTRHTRTHRCCFAGGRRSLRSPATIIMEKLHSSPSSPRASPEGIPEGLTRSDSGIPDDELSQFQRLENQFLGRQLQVYNYLVIKYN